MLDSVKQEIVQSLRERKDLEGCVNFMYLDTADPPVVTTGIGHAMHTEADVIALPWDKPVSIVRADYRTVKNCSLRNHKAEAFARYTSSRLPMDFIRGKLLELDVYRECGRLEQTFHEIDDMPHAVQLAVGEMAFNRGGFFLMEKLHKAPKFRAALLAGDWATAAAECSSSAIPEYRNKHFAEMILSAGKASVINA